MIKLHGNDLVNAFTLGNNVSVIYNEGEIIWPYPNYSYYINWYPSTTSGQFNVDGTSHYLGTFRGHFTWSSGLISERAFFHPSPSSITFTRIDTNALSVGSSAFRYMTTLVAASLSNCQYIDTSAFDHTKLNSVYLPQCSFIGDYAFAYCSLLTSVSAENCKYISSNAFEYCYSLSGISLPECTYIGSVTFYNCSSLSWVSLPKCSYIGAQAFKGCSLITSINLPECTSIAFEAFYDIPNLSSISLPVCEYIGKSAFYNCFRTGSNVTVTLPECKSIASGAFQSCYYLKTLHLSKCSYISGSNTFAWCSRLSSVYLYSNNVCDLRSAWAFEGTSAGLRIYVPTSLVDAYKTSTVWKNLSSRIYPI